MLKVTEKLPLYTEKRMTLIFHFAVAEQQHTGNVIGCGVTLGVALDLPGQRRLLCHG